jgi:hypothetical protein
MPTVQVPAQLSIEHLLAAIKQLSPAELREFKRRFEEWQAQNGQQGEAETELIRATKARLPAADERRLKRLIAKSERSTLTATELTEYRALTERAERIDAMRVKALAELVRQRGKPAHFVKQEIGWKGGDDGA